ncbi:MAG TPA: lysylphosphatidylglycerol synthase transmembrane domain-containing protein [Gemmataceae bacterium]|nr:lysylphosphatidylglycerol synthase transmembrane domain-containing protein [Gemmataceae bacterium]
MRSLTKLLKLGISVGLLGWLAWRTDWSQVREALAEVRLQTWLFALALYLGSQVVSGIRWSWLARPFGFRAPLWRYVECILIGMYFNLFLPTSVGGDVVRAWYLDANSGRRAEAFVSVFADRLTGLLVLVMLACLAVVLSPVAMPPWVPACVWTVAGCTVAAVVALPLVTRWTHRFTRFQPAAKAIRFYVRHPRVLLAALALSVLVQAANIVLVWILGQAITPQVPPLYYWIFVPMVTLLTLVPISLNGMGVREWGVVWFLHPFGVVAGAALSLSFLWFLVMTMSSLLGGAVYLVRSFPQSEVQPSHEPVGHHPYQGRAGQPEAIARSAAASPDSTRARV